MRIDASKIKYEDFARWADDATMQQVSNACGECEMGDLWQLTIKDFGDIAKGCIPKRLAACFEYEEQANRMWNRRKKISVKTYLARYNTLKTFVGVFINAMHDFSIKETPESIQAARGLPSFNETEGLLVFVRYYFGLKDFTTAENVTLADVYLAKKDAFIKASYERNYNDIIIKKTTKK